MVPLVSRLRPADAGELAAAAAQFGEVVDEAEASQEVLHKANSLQGLAFALAYQGELSAARAAADAALEAAELGEYFAGMGYSALTTAALAAGDVQTAQHASEAAWRNLSLALPLSAAVQRAFNAQAALAGGDLSAARRWCDDAVQSMTGHHLAMALATRARIAVAEGKREEAERDAHKAPRARPRAGHTWISPTCSNALPAWPATPAPTMRRHDSSAPPRLSDSRSARSASRFTVRTMCSR